MQKDKKISLPALAIKNLKAKKFRTAFMMFYVILMSATVFFSTLMMDNLELGIKNTTERMGADIIVVPKEGTENIRESLFAGEPCSVFFDRTWEEAVRGIEGVTAVSPQLYVATLATSCCDAAIQIIAYDPETDFVVKPWLKDQKGFELEKGEVVVGSKIEAHEGEQIKLYDTMFDVERQMEKTGMGYDSSVFMTFETLYELKNSGPASEVLPLDDMENVASMLMVNIEDNINADVMERVRLKTKIEGAVEGGEKMYACTADDLMSGIASQVNKLSGYGNILTYISLISTALALISIFVLTINERKYEFGILYTLGASKRQMTSVILSEALIISAIGGVIGVGLAYYLVSIFKNVISVKLDIPYLDISAEQVVPVAVMCIVIAVVTGIIAAVCSAYRISKDEAYRLIRESE